MTIGLMSCHKRFERLSLFHESSFTLATREQHGAWSIHLLYIKGEPVVKRGTGKAIWDSLIGLFIICVRYIYQVSVLQSPPSWYGLLRFKISGKV